MGDSQEPIVSTPEDAISCYLRTGMDALAIGDFYCTDRNEAAVSWAHRVFEKRKARTADVPVE